MDQSNENRDSPWDFKSARDFLSSYTSSPSDNILVDVSIPDLNVYDPKSQAPKGLGDFDRLFAFCGKPLKIPPRRRSPDSSSAQYEENSTPPSSAPDDETIHFEEFVAKGKEVRWTDQEGTANLVEFRRRSLRGSRAEDPYVSVIAHLLEEPDPSGFESDTEDDPTPTPKHSAISKHTRTLNAVPTSPVRTPSKDRDKNNFQRQSPHSISNISSLLPASVTPVKSFEILSRPPPPINPHDFTDSSIIKPQYTLTANEQKAKLVKKLSRRFGQEATLVKNLEAVTHKGGNLHSTGIHVFVDLSNIVIGFCERIKVNRIKAGKLRLGAHVKQPPFSFHSLALILERGRAVGRRVMAGSTNNMLYDPYGHKLPNHVLEGEKLGYESNILERVAKPHRVTPQKKRGGTGSGYATSGYSSASETQTSGRLKMQEQAVDELLQMKMLESIVDSQPSTIVLASGDAAEAEYSGGFLKTVERALEKGWKVEIVAWSQSLSYEYRSKELLTKWANRLSIIELDDFCEEMLAIYTQKWAQTVFA
ncbi:hypothetical protein EG329_009724 [Mollisiaceae sp. DMI_Dod_QoI]|nr:hypothetical protein EG329_009724 [Helotiales sp. DMI_Dod_QoI]